MDNIDLVSVIVWLIVGALGGYIAGMIIKVRQRGFGVVGNIVIGLVGAILGGFLFDALKISIPGEIQFQDVIAAVVGSLILVIVLSFIRRR